MLHKKYSLHKSTPPTICSLKENFVLHWQAMESEIFKSTDYSNTQKRTTKMLEGNPRTHDLDSSRHDHTDLYALNISAPDRFTVIKRAGETQCSGELYADCSFRWLKVGLSFLKACTFVMITG